MPVVDQQEIYIGWVTAEGVEQLAADHEPLATTDAAQRAVDQLNEVEGRKGSGDEWFVLVGSETCPAGPCAECDSGPDAAADPKAFVGPWHHWQPNVPQFGEPRLSCKHCDAWRTLTENNDDELL